jgi:hypothetical protein
MPLVVAAVGIILVCGLIGVFVWVSRSRFADARANAARIAEVIGKEERANELAKAKEEEARLQFCKEIVARIQAQQLTADDESWLGLEGALARRIQTGALGAQDLSLQMAGLQCGEPFFDLLVPVAAGATSLWAGVSKADDVSQDLVIALSGKTALAKLTKASREAFRNRVASLASRDIVGAKHASDCERAFYLCGLADQIDDTRIPACTKALAKHEQLKKREAAAWEKQRERTVAQEHAAEVKERQQNERSERRCESLRNRQDSCMSRCVLGYGADDPRSESCIDRCTNMLNGTGCD